MEDLLYHLLTIFRQLSEVWQTISWTPWRILKKIFGKKIIAYTSGAVERQVTWEWKIEGSIPCHAKRLWCSWARHQIPICSPGSYIIALCSTDWLNPELKFCQCKGTHSDDNILLIYIAHITHTYLQLINFLKVLLKFIQWFMKLWTKLTSKATSNV